MNQWTVDLSEIQDRLNDPEIRQFCDEVQNADIQFINAICVHEAAHGIYMVRAGAIDLKRRGPKIGYDTQRGEPFVSPAAVAPVFPKPWKADLDAVARYHAAGGISERTLTIQTYVGDQKDFEDFRSFCDFYFPKYSIEAQTRWDRAQKEVAQDLRISAFQKEVWAKAFEFRDWLCYSH
jgi:hypothetical protein